MAYLVDALFSRGYAATDELVSQLLDSRAKGGGDGLLPFFRLLQASWSAWPDLAESALEHLLNAIDSGKHLELRWAYQALCDGLEAGEGMEDAVGQASWTGGEDDGVADLEERRKKSRFKSRLEQILPGCMLLRKVVVTPLRRILMPREMMMGNRILRRYGEELALRLVFRSEDGRQLLSFTHRRHGRCQKPPYPPP